MNQVQSMNIEELCEEFDDLGDWEDQCEYLIELGLELPPIEAHERDEQNRVHGCQSNVWLVADIHQQDDEPAITLRADSDSMFVKGLVVILLMIYSGLTAREILAIDAMSTFKRLGLDRHLTSQRRNGLFGMVQRIRAIAAESVR